MEIVELPFGEDPRRVAGEALTQRPAIGQERCPLTDDVARARAQRATGVLDGVSGRGVELAVAHPGRERGDPPVERPLLAVPEGEHVVAADLARYLGGELGPA